MTQTRLHSIQTHKNRVGFASCSHIVSNFAGPRPNAYVLRPPDVGLAWLFMGFDTSHSNDPFCSLLFRSYLSSLKATMGSVNLTVSLKINRSSVFGLLFGFLVGSVSLI